MIFGLEFTDDVDPTALATLVLALMTLGSLLLTLRSLRYTKRALEQTREEINISRREVEEAHRPVVVPIIDATRKMKPDRSDSPSVGPQLMSQGMLWVPVENVGSGPALDIEISIQLVNPVGDPSSGSDSTSGAIAGLGVDRLLPVEVRMPGLPGVSDFEIDVTYSDVAGKGWRTSARYVASHDRYESLSILSADAASR